MGRTDELLAIVERRTRFLHGIGLGRLRTLLGRAARVAGRAHAVQTPFGQLRGGPEYLKYLADVQGGQAEPGTTAVFIEQLTPASTVIDVGAYIGFYSLAACHLGCERVIAIEADRRNYSWLVQNIPPSGITNSRVTCYNLAAGSRLETRELRLGGGGRSTTSLVPVGSQGDIAVPTTPIDNLLGSPQRSFRHLVVKIDVEGFELDVLRGMRHTLMRSQRASVIFEVNQQALSSGNQAESAVFEFLKGCGFTVLGMINEGSAAIEPIPRSGSPKKYFNCLACKGSPVKNSG